MRAHRIDSLKPSSSSLSLILSKEVRSNQPCILMPIFNEMDLCRYVFLHYSTVKTSIHRRTHAVSWTKCSQMQHLRCCRKDDLCVAHAFCNVKFSHICPACPCRPNII